MSAPAVRVRARVNLSIAQETALRLQRAANQGRYVDFAVRDRARRWLRALAHLSVAGFPSAVVYAAREPLAALHPLRCDAADIWGALQAADVSAWGLRPEVWTQCVAACGTHPVLAEALRDVALELEAGNLDVAQALEQALEPPKDAAAR